MISNMGGPGSGRPKTRERDLIEDCADDYLIDIDKKARFHYQVGYWFRLIDASICWARDEVDT